MADWFTIDKNSGSGDGNVIITASSNEELMEKIAKLRVTTLNGRTKDVSVREKAFKTAPSTLIFPYKNAETQSLHIYCSNGWTISKPDWVLVSSTSGQGDGFISVNVEDNEDLYREGAITITASNGMVRTISVAQAEMEHHTISASPDMLDFGYKGGDFTINIVTDYEWIAVPPAGVTLSQYSGVGNAVVTGTKDKNESEDVYSGVIVFSTDTDSTSVMIAQSGKPSPESIWIEVTPSSCDFSGGDDFATIIMRTNAEAWNYVSSSFGRIIVNEEYMEGDVLNAVLTISVDGNPSIEETRSGQVIFNALFDGEVFANEVFTYTQAEGYEPYFYFRTKQGSSGKVVLYNSETNNNYTLKYRRKNDTDWTTFQVGYESRSPVLQDDDVIYVKGVKNVTNVVRFLKHFVVTGEVYCGGNILTLLGEDVTEIPEIDHFFENLFGGSTGLMNAPQLPMMKLQPYCYCRMFRGCTNLTYMPSLPARELPEGCYVSMFENCKSLRYVPLITADTAGYLSLNYMFRYSGVKVAEGVSIGTLARRSCLEMFTNSEIERVNTIEATELAEECFSNMFASCRNLKIAPSVIPMTNLAKLCYVNMFTRTGLETAPELPATILAESCYNGMFSNCESLVNAPELPALTLAKSCYNGMFLNCTSLETAPELPAENLEPSCYSSMFQWCQKLNTIRIASITALSSSYSSDWVFDVSTEGTFYQKAGVTHPSGNNGVPTGWTIVNY